jgi:hypothetical protein
MDFGLEVSPVFFLFTVFFFVEAAEGATDEDFEDFTFFVRLVRPEEGSMLGEEAEEEREAEE